MVFFSFPLKMRSLLSMYTLSLALFTFPKFAFFSRLFFLKVQSLPGMVTHAFSPRTQEEDTDIVTLHDMCQIL